MQVGSPETAGLFQQPQNGAWESVLVCILYAACLILAPRLALLGDTAGHFDWPGNLGWKLASLVTNGHGYQGSGSDHTLGPSVEEPASTAKFP